VVEKFVLGLVGAPFGLEGFVKVKPFSGETGHFFRLGTVILKQGGGEKTWDVAEIIPREASLLMRFAGIDSAEAAASLRGAEIIAGREYAAPLNEGEYYVEDLKGLEVTSREGEILGHISNMVEGGGGQLAEVTLRNGEKRLAPFRKEFFGEVSLEQGRIILLEPWILNEP
jgi:16S rRNA processing protein RimM